MKALPFFFPLLPAVLWATPRASTNYVLSPETIDGAGQRTTSVNYVHDGSLAQLGGLASAPQEVVKSGYVGQLYDVVSLQLAASPTAIDELTTRQLAACQLLDDTTRLAVTPSAVTWSVIDGPITSVSTAGIVTADVVYQNSGANVGGSYLGVNSSLGLTILNTNPDNFGSYAGDTLDDDWQVGFFGLDNPQAAPNANPDGDTQDNRFEFIGDLDPTDPDSFLRLELHPSTAYPGGMDLVFWPVKTGRTYAVSRNPTLAPSAWSSLVSPPTSESNGVRTVTDLTGHEQREFYRIEVTKP